MKALTARAADLSARRELRPIPLVVLTTYTDRGAGTVDTIYRFSNRTVLYDYGNTGTEREFGAFLLGLDPLAQQMNHLPDLSTGSLERSMALQLANLPVDGGSRLYEILEAKRLLFATIEIAQILLDPGKRETVGDLRSLAGDEHQVWFRGEIVAHGADEASITLTVRATQRSIPWIVANVPTTNDPIDVGRRLPIVYGARTRVPCVGYSVGWATTLSGGVSPSSHLGDFEVTDASGLSGSGITLRIGNEEVTAHKVDDKTLNLDARGINGTLATIHGSGESVIEMVSPVVFVVAGHALSSIGDFYLANPTTGELVRVPPGNYTATPSDTSTISGKTVASVSFTATQLRSVLNDLFPGLNFSSATENFIQTPSATEVRTTTNADFDYQTISGLTATGSDGAGTRRFLRCSFPVGSIPNNTREVVRARLVCAGGGTSTEARSIGVAVLDYDSDLPGFTAGDEASFTTGPNATVSGRTAYSPWRTPPAGTTLADYETNAPNTAGEPEFQFKIRNHNGTAPDPQSDESGTLSGSWGIEFEVFSPITGVLVGALVGFGLRGYADVQGPVASGGSYTVSNGTLLEHPSDVLRHVIADLCGYGQSAVDDTTFDGLVTALGSGAKMAPILNSLGGDFAQVVQRLALESRANLVQEEAAAGTVFKVYAASSSWAWGASERTLNVFDRISIETRDGSQVATRFRALYAPDLSKGQDDAWAKALRADPEASDLASLTTANLIDAEEDFGRRDHEGFAFASLFDDATAKDVMTYYGKEHSRDARVLRVQGLPWWLAYDLERGSIVSVPPPWSASTFKCRVVGYLKNHDSEKVDAIGVEIA